METCFLEETLVCIEKDESLGELILTKISFVYYWKLSDINGGVDKVG